MWNVGEEESKAWRWEGGSIGAMRPKAKAVEHQMSRSAQATPIPMTKVTPAQASRVNAA